MSNRLLLRRGFAAGAAALAVASAARATDPPWIDAHTHVFVRGLPMAIDARYRPDYDASWETLLALAEKNGVGRAVILQPSFLGFDNSYLFETLRARRQPFAHASACCAAGRARRVRLARFGFGCWIPSIAAAPFIFALPRRVCLLRERAAMVRVELRPLALPWPEAAR